MANEPITREEILLNAVATGERADIKPITREEMFLAKLGGADVTTPVPITRKEQFLQKAIDGAGGGGSGGGGSTEDWFNDGNTHIWITLTEGRTSPMLGCCPNGTVTVDWGDGTEPDVLTGTSTNTTVWTPNHQYAKPGDYVITLTTDGELGLYGDNGNNTGSRILRYSSSSDSRNYVYRNAIKKVEIAGIADVAYAAFNNCHALKSVKIHNGITKIHQHMFSYCYTLESVTIPSSVTKIDYNAFLTCYSLASVTIPSSVTSFGNTAFQNCYGMKFYDFTKHTEIPELPSTNVFMSIPSDCQIRVPNNLLLDWLIATNWSNYGNQMVGL